MLLNPAVELKKIAALLNTVAAIAVMRGEKLHAAFEGRSPAKSAAT
jgi:hypothetical protein